MIKVKKLKKKETIYSQYFVLHSKGSCWLWEDQCDLEWFNENEKLAVQRTVNPALGYGWVREAAEKQHWYEWTFLRNGILFFFCVCTRSPDTWLRTVAFNYRDNFSLLKFYVI